MQLSIPAICKWPQHRKYVPKALKFFTCLCKQTASLLTFIINMCMFVQSLQSSDARAVLFAAPRALSWAPQASGPTSCVGYPDRHKHCPPCNNAHNSITGEDQSFRRNSGAPVHPACGPCKHGLPTNMRTVHVSFTSASCQLHDTQAHHRPTQSITGVCSISHVLSRSWLHVMH